MSRLVRIATIRVAGTSIEQVDLEHWLAIPRARSEEQARDMGGCSASGQLHTYAGPWAGEFSSDGSRGDLSPGERLQLLNLIAKEFKSICDSGLCSFGELVDTQSRIRFDE